MKQMAIATIARLAEYIAPTPAKGVLGIALQALAGPVLTEPHTWDVTKPSADLTVSANV